MTWLLPAQVTGCCGRYFTAIVERVRSWRLGVESWVRILSTPVYFRTWHPPLTAAPFLKNIAPVRSVNNVSKKKRKWVFKRNPFRLGAVVLARFRARARFPPWSTCCQSSHVFRYCERGRNSYSRTDTFDLIPNNYGISETMQKILQFATYLPTRSTMFRSWNSSAAFRNVPEFGYL